MPCRPQSVPIDCSEWDRSRMTTPGPPFVVAISRTVVISSPHNKGNPAIASGNRLKYYYACILYLSHTAYKHPSTISTSVLLSRSSTPSQCRPSLPLSNSWNHSASLPARSFPSPELLARIPALSHARLPSRTPALALVARVLQVLLFPLSSPMCKERDHRRSSCPTTMLQKREGPTL